MKELQLVILELFGTYCIYHYTRKPITHDKIRDLVITLFGVIFWISIILNN